MARALCWTEVTSVNSKRNIKNTNKKMKTQKSTNKRPAEIRDPMTDFSSISTLETSSTKIASMYSDPLFIMKFLTFKIMRLP